MNHPFIMTSLELQDTDVRGLIFNKAREWFLETV